MFSCYYCSIELKRRSEPSGLCPDTSSFVSIYVGRRSYFLNNPTIALKNMGKEFLNNYCFLKKYLRIKATVEFFFCQWIALIGF